MKQVFLLVKRGIEVNLNPKKRNKGLLSVSEFLQGARATWGRSLVLLGLVRLTVVIPGRVCKVWGQTISGEVGLKQDTGLRARHWFGKPDKTCPRKPSTLNPEA